MEKILVVDDDECFLESMVRMLQADYAVHGCARAAEALAWACEHQPDLIFLDVMMDDIDGYELCRRLQARRETRAIPLIFISSLDSLQDEARGLALGASDYLSKPLNPAITLARIRNHIKLKRGEEQLRRLSATMEDLILQRTAQLNQALDAAKIAERTKDAFLANITHELRTPLAAVLGFAGLALPLCTDAQQQQYLEKIAVAGNLLSGIVNDLLDLSKIAAGSMQLETLSFSLRSLLARDLSLMSYKAAEKGLELNERVDPEVPDDLVGDPLRLEQILLNLLSNALKFTAAGRIDLRIGLCGREDGRICLALEVEDTGIGLRPEEMASLFKPFSQADDSMTRKFGGTGLGLAICKRLAEMMDGEISVSSRAGHGATFRVKVWFGLGRLGESLPAPQAARPLARRLYQEVRVLVVDDQAFNRDVVEGLLAVVGITPRHACNGHEALELLGVAGERFDLVLMDIQMPVMDGLTATRVIRQLPGLEGLPIIAMTAHTMAHERAQHLADGMNDHIGKPFDEDSFYRLLARWIPAAKQRLQADADAGGGRAASTMPAIPGIDTRAGLALLQNDEARYRGWLRDFAGWAPTAIAAIRAALAAHQAEAASMAAHALKGRCGLLGMKDLHGVAAALEAAIDGAAPAAALLLDLERGALAVCGALRSALGPELESSPALTIDHGGER